MATLYEINKDIENCIQFDDETFVNQETGELINTEQLDKLELDRMEKLKNIALMIKNKRADAKMYKEEENIFKQRRKSAENSVEWLTKYLVANMQEGEKLKAAECEIGWRKSQSVEITCKVSELPEKYQKTAEPTADKEGLKKALKGGASIDGVSLVDKKNIQIK